MCGPLHIHLLCSNWTGVPSRPSTSVGQKLLRTARAGYLVYQLCDIISVAVEAELTLIKVFYALVTHTTVSQGKRVLITPEGSDPLCMLIPYCLLRMTRTHQYH